ncbi:hypothetical protein JTE90_021989 [Oedothorax gibbosus]|uniref:Uncharacterized protein n=1 Tax=Oedothorax gibbosus TaxID=931172 RepID=A0AAV6U4A6_9ARAC|nr:hypothetical protein JTE90_021989 [Oedothorax gibbosus]
MIKLAKFAKKAPLVHPSELKRHPGRKNKKEGPEASIPRTTSFRRGNIARDLNPRGALGRHVARGHLGGRDPFTFHP